ncbi:hypothetical protein HDU79_008218 [Rhizoclosmatium sp. JEL0117]|nr:hypothetical protein HDU79_008218 [Rhizoclosmatium sp. JEL0117]
MNPYNLLKAKSKLKSVTLSSASIKKQVLAVTGTLGIVLVILMLHFHEIKVWVDEIGVSLNRCDDAHRYEGFSQSRVDKSGACRFTSLHKNTTNSSPRVLYYNTHAGTRENMKGVMQSLGMHLDEFNSDIVAHVGNTGRRSRQLIREGHAAWVIIADTIPHGRQLFESWLHPDPLKHCGSKIILEMTNRFDWDVTDKFTYYANLRKIIATTHNRLYFVSNNNAEFAWLQDKLGIKISGLKHILRPLGLSKSYEYPFFLPAPSKSSLLSKSEYFPRLYKTMEKDYNLSLTLIPEHERKYGGPATLLQFKGFLEFPYQYSVMKFYENIAYGVPQYIPSSKLLKKILNGGKQACYHCARVEVLEGFVGRFDIPVKTLDRWSGFMDFYDPLFEPFVYYFDSFKELERIDGMSWLDADWKRVREKGPQFYHSYRKEILDGWRNVFGEVLG